MTVTKLRGFAAMTPERVREICSMGGKSVPAGSRSFSRNRTLASTAGRKGGTATAPEKRSFAQDRQLAREAGKKGGSAIPAEKRAYSLDTELARSAGRKGGLARRTQPPTDKPT